MTRPLLVEEESGTSTGVFHPHRGYHAGDFFARTVASPQAAKLPLSEPSSRLVRRAAFSVAA